MNLKKIVLLILLFMTFAITGCGEEKQVSVAKPEYIYKDIVTKHGDSFRIQRNMFEEIKKSVATSKNIVVRKNIETKTEEICSDDEYKEERGKPLYLREIFYDKNGREVYIIDDKKKADTNGSIRGYRETPYYPNEIGYVYGSNGKIVKEFKSLLSSSTYTLMGNRKSMYKNTPVWNIETKEYEYDSNNLLTKERRIKFIYSVQTYESSEKEYENGKLKKEKIVMDMEYYDSSTSLIYVEITKEYDENEKLIKKFVLRKNKFNAVRSETNFDFIKGEIVTKYYDGEKAFATVTETLIGKDRAIVKRERVGDEFVIWDCFTIKGKTVNFMRYVVKKNEIEKIFGNENNFREIRTQYYEYNDEKSGIKNIDFIFYTYSIAEIQKIDGVQKYIWDGIVKEISSNGNLIVEEKEIGKTLYSLEDLKISTPEEDFTSYLYNLDKTIKEKLFKNEKEYNISKEKYEEIKNKFKEQIGGF